MFVDKKLIESILSKSYAEGLLNLNLSYCDLKEVPFFLLERPLLIIEKGEFDKNKDEHTEMEVYKNLELNKVKHLNLSNNYLSCIDSKITSFQNLESLDISINKLERLPRQICELGNLKKLIAHNNPLFQLPQKLASFQMLEILDISNTELHDIPNSIQYLNNLKVLKLNNCKISVLPKEIFYLPNINTIELNGNPLVDPPIEIAVKGIEAVKHYFEELEACTEKDFLYEVKLLLIGEERAGKSTIAEALSNPEFEFDLYKKSTQGIDIKKWVIEQNKLDINKDFQINIWDFGGQEIYHATHQFFFTKRSLYFLVTEARKDLRHDDLFYWLNLIEILGNNSPVSILINKCDQAHTFFATDSYREKFPNIIGTKNVSCLPEYKGTITELKENVYSILSNKELMPDIGVELPKVWIDIRNELKKIRDTGVNYIKLSRYFTICKKYDMNEERALFLSDYFHDLGVFLHFQDDFILKETIFLNFEWVTNAVYCVLDNPKVVSNHGFFDNSDLEKIWEKHNYNNKRLELLTLMKNEKFEVCFEIEEGKYLAPQLLHPDKVTFKLERDKSVSSIEYRYEFMPKGLISRFIVKKHDMIYEKSYWKHGVVLFYKSTKAIVEEKYFESPKKISIRIQGKEKKELFSFIRKTIEEINGSFNNIVVHEMIQCNCDNCVDNKNPNFYNLKELQNRLKNKRYNVECNNPPYQRISIPSLVNEIISDIHFIDTPTIPEDFADFEQNKISEELFKTQEDLVSIKTEFAKEKEKLELAKKLNREIEEIKIKLEKLGGFKEILDNKALKKARLIDWYYFFINALSISVWSILIYYFTWDTMEKYTYIFSLILASFSSFYFIKRRINFNHKEVWESKLNSHMLILYKKNMFSIQEYIDLKNSYGQLNLEYKKLMN